jgi:hypothetical protein
MNVKRIIRKYMSFSPVTGSGHAGDLARVGTGFSLAAVGNGWRGAQESSAGACKENFWKGAGAHRNLPVEILASVASRTTSY